MTKEARFSIVNTTVSGEEDARKLAEKIVAEKLAACAQYMPIRSVYRWKGAVESAPEFLLIAKTRTSLAPKLVAFIRANHAYEVPEILVTRLEDGLPEYLAWIEAETGE